MFVYICTAWSNIGVCLLVTPTPPAKMLATMALRRLYSAAAKQRGRVKDSGEEQEKKKIIKREKRNGRRKKKREI